jgi:hypothetical protein
LLSEVPGESKPDLAYQILLGHAYRLISSHTVSPEHVLRQLYKLSFYEGFSDEIYIKLSAFDDDLSLAHQGIYRSVADVIQQFIFFLADFEPYALEP